MDYSKTDTKQIIGPSGVRTILERLSTLSDLPKRAATVAIGGINTSNVQRVMFQSKAAYRALDGVAVVSAIVAAKSPNHAASELRSLLRRPPAFYREAEAGLYSKDTASMISQVTPIAKRVIESGPLSQCVQKDIPDVVCY